MTLAINEKIALVQLSATPALQHPTIPGKYGIVELLDKYDTILIHLNYTTNTGKINCFHICIARTGEAVRFH